VSVAAGPDVPAFSRDRTVHSWLALKGVSDAGDAAWTIALAWTAVQVASPAVAGLVVAAGSVPRALVLLLGGVVADRFDTLRVLRLVTAARVAVLLTTVAEVQFTGVSVPLLLAVAVAFGVCDALFEPSVVTLSRQLVREEDLAAYAGAGQTASRLGTMLGAGLGGGLVALGGLTATALVNAATYVLVFLVLTLVLRARFPLPRAGSEPVLRSISAGFHYLRRDATAGSLVLALLGLNLAVGPALGLGVALRVQDEQWGPAMLGLLQALVGLGAVGGAVALVRWRPRREARTGFVLLVVQGLAIMLLAAPGRAAATVACLVIGITAGSASSVLSAVFVRTVAPHFLGRVASMQRLGDDVLMPAAMAGFGALAGGASLPVAFTVFGGAMAALMLLSATGRRWAGPSSRRAGPQPGPKGWATS
jgi:MFS family permease